MRQVRLYLEGEDSMNVPETIEIGDRSFFTSPAPGRQKVCRNSNCLRPIFNTMHSICSTTCLMWCLQENVSIVQPIWDGGNKGMTKKR